MAQELGLLKGGFLGMTPKKPEIEAMVCISRQVLVWPLSGCLIRESRFVIFQGHAAAQQNFRWESPKKQKIKKTRVFLILMFFVHPLECVDNKRIISLSLTYGVKKITFGEG